MKKLLIIIIVGTGLVLGTLFSSGGQRNILLPLVNLYLKYTLPDHRVVLVTLEPGLDRVRLEGSFDQTIRFSAEGPVHWWSSRFDLEYRIDGDGIRLEGHRYPVSLALKGKLEGDLPGILIKGSGKAFGAQIDYRLTLERKELRGIKVRVEGAEVAQLLVLSGQRPYAEGRMNLQIDIPEFDTRHPAGNARFSIVDGTIDSRRLKMDFGIELPKVGRYRAEGRFHLADGLIKGEATLRSPLADLDLKHFRSDTELQIFKSGYRLSIPELSRLRRLTGTTLYGPWDMEGEFYFDRNNDKLQLRGESPSLEGKSTFFYDDGRMRFNVSEAGIPQVLALLGEPPLVASGRFGIRGSFSDLHHVTGNYLLEATGVWDRKEMTGVVGRDPGTDLGFTLRSNGVIEKGILKAEALYHNRLFTLILSPLRYALAEKALEGSYMLRIPELSRMVFLGQGSAQGKVEFRGNIRYLPVKRLLKIDGNSRSFGGETRFLYAGKRFTLTLKGVDGVRLAQLVGSEVPLKNSRVDATVKFSDLQGKIGSFFLSLRGELDRKLLRKRWEVDPGKSVDVRLKGQGMIKGEALESLWSVESSLAVLTLEKCRIRLSDGKCDSIYRLKIPELERLEPLTGRVYHGPIALTGRFEWDGQIHLDGAGREWGGRIEYRLKGAQLQIKAGKLRMKELMPVLGYPSLIDGVVSGDLRYDLDTEKGTLKAHMDKSRFIQSPLTSVASHLLRYDLTKERFDRVELDARIDGALVLFDLQAHSRRLRMDIREGRLDRKRGTIDALVSIDDRGKRYRMQLRGPLDRPKVIPLVTRDLVKKAERTLRKDMTEKNVSEKERESGNPVSDLIKKLF